MFHFRCHPNIEIHDKRMGGEETIVCVNGSTCQVVESLHNRICKCLYGFAINIAVCYVLSVNWYQRILQNVPRECGLEAWSKLPSQ
jgi:hypothetical protein